MAEDSEDQRTERIDRRAMLRRGGGMLAGAAGATALGAVAAPSAGAAPGGNFILGQSNDAEGASTQLQSSGEPATLVVSNSAGGAPLRLVGDTTTFPLSTTAGELYSAFSEWLQIHSGDADPAGRIGGWVHTSATSNTLVAIPPARVVDTRSSGGRQRILNPEVLDASGRVPTGSAIKVALNEYVFDGIAMNCNLTAVAPTGSGWLSVLPEYSGSAPSTSSLNFVANQTIANFAVATIGHLDGGDYVWVYAARTTHVLLDASGFVAGDWTQVAGGVGPSSLGTPSAVAPSAVGGRTSQVSIQDLAARRAARQ